VTNWLWRFLVSAVALGIVSKINIGVDIKDTPSLIEATVVIGLVNSLIKPILKFLTLPLNCLTFGLFGFFLNALLFAATHLVVVGFKTTFPGAVWGSLLMGLLSSLLGSLIPDKKKDK
jgi:putative membrane protein